mmetsp:Transcript_14635/g.40671  ORF Transcript_14635/g.40671 Transcript_14635/m.40671 type:complete len:321 (+) Transcript_14635:143-1105(+)
MSDTDDREDDLKASDEAETERKELGKNDSNKKKQKKSKKKKKRKKVEEESKEEIPPSSVDPGALTKDGKIEASMNEKNEATASNSDDDDNNDDDLLAAAALWAREEAEEDETEKMSSKSTSFHPSGYTKSQQNYSLHITQLPYDSTDFDLRKLFAEHGCTVTSIRLVYDHDTDGRKTLFRGVAFVDVLDSQSYETALKLHHKTSIRGRRLNVRPCRSKGELAEIVARTQELVKEKIRQQRSGDTTETNVTSEEPAQSSAPKSKSNENKISASKRKNQNSKERKSNKKPRVDKDGKPIKLTKKERNRRAAIIMQKRRRQKK